MKSFLLKTAVFSFIVLIVVVSVNYLGDAAKLYNTDFEVHIAEILLENKNATNLSNYDERILQREVIERIGFSPDIVVLGSSRTMLINSSFFKNKSFWNNSVSGASLEDLIAIYQLYKTNGVLPHRIIMGVDPWMFNKNNDQKRWVSLTNEYNDFFDKDILKKDPLIQDKYNQLFSFSYFQASLKALPKVLKGGANPVSTNDFDNESITKLADGSTVYARKLRESTPAEVEMEARNYVSDRLYSIENYNEIYPKLWNEFDLLCKDILENDIELEFILTPYHPLVYDKISKEYPMVLESEKKVKKYAIEHNIEVYGSYDPKILNVGKEGFYDGMHSKATTIEKILNP